MRSRKIIIIFSIVEACFGLWFLSGLTVPFCLRGELVGFAVEVLGSELNMENVRKLKTGMTEEDVGKIFGEPTFGEPTDSRSVDEGYFMMLSWYHGKRYVHVNFIDGYIFKCVFFDSTALHEFVYDCPESTHEDPMKERRRKYHFEMLSESDRELREIQKKRDESE